MKLSILLGAGSSLPAGYPSTRCLTDQILSGSGVYRDSDETYNIGKFQPIDGPTPLVNCAVRWIYAEAESYHSVHTNRQANYEDTLYLLDQLLAEERGEKENPAVKPFATNLRTDLAHLVRRQSNMNYVDLLRESLHYVADIIWRSLDKSAENTNHLKVLEDMCKSGCVNSISTLCHDTHVETYLDKQNISLADGFSEEENSVRYWQNEFPNDKIPLLKLHGSVNWFRLRPDNAQPWYDDRIGIPLDSDYEHTKNADGQYQTPLDGRPILLIGTFNKISEYTEGMFRDIHYKFRQSIQNADQLLVCGYSFGDKGINSEIVEWFYARRGRRILIIHPKPEELKMNARGAIQTKWDDWNKNSAIQLIPKKLEDLEMNEFWQCIHN